MWPSKPGIFWVILPQCCVLPLKCPAAFLFINNPEYSAQRRSPRHNFTSAVQSNDWVGRVVKSTDPAISPFHYTAEKCQVNGVFIFCSQFTEENRTRTTKGGGKAW